VPGVTPLLGQSVGRYQIEAVVGSGGFATVYRAVDTVLARPVALKVVDPAAHRNPTTARRFIHEGRAVAQLNHQAVVPVYDAGEHDGVLWLAMRLIDGSSVGELMTEGRRFPVDHIVALVERIGAALDHAHGAGIIHRDVKPSNILLEQRDPARAYLTDFGIAATARTAGLYTTGIIGTAAYMAPEQSRPSEVGPAADLYSLTCVAYEMFSGRRPFPGEDHVALLLAHATSAVPPTGHDAFDALMARALAKQPDQRPASGAILAGELRQAVSDALAGETTTPATATAASDAPTVPEHWEPDVTLVDNRDKTLAYPVPPPPIHGPPPGQPPPHVQPMPGGYPPHPAAGPPPPRDPTVARRSRNRGRQRLIAGSVVLAAGAAVAAVAVAELRDSSTRPIRDSAGVRYEVPKQWTPDDQPGVVQWSLDGELVATIENSPASGSEAASALAEAEPETCAGDGLPEATNLPGADSAAACHRPEGTDPATAAAAIANDRLWIIRVSPGISQGQREAFVSSFDFTS
jgi:serine/threonine protein kinase